MTVFDFLMDHLEHFTIGKYKNGLRFVGRDIEIDIVKDSETGKYRMDNMGWNNTYEKYIENGQILELISLIEHTKIEEEQGKQKMKSIKQWEFIKQLDLKDAAEILYINAFALGSCDEFYKWLNERIGVIE